jgi:AcrR family transcriptional regulator
MLAAMAEVCAERGIDDVTVTHIVARSGASRRTFYDLFADREDCFLATLEQALARAAEYVLPAYRQEARWHERMRASLAALLSFVEDEPSLARLMIVETLKAGPAALQLRKNTIASAVAAVDEGRTAARSGERLPSLTAHGVVGGVLSVIHAHLTEPDGSALIELAGPLTSIVVLPYLGRAVAQSELDRDLPARRAKTLTPANPLQDTHMRLTYRTMRVLSSVATQPGSSNRQIAYAAGIDDQGQISKLLTRLHRLGLIQKTGTNGMQGTPNAWTLTTKGTQIQHALINHTKLHARRGTTRAESASG